MFASGGKILADGFEVAFVVVLQECHLEAFFAAAAGDVDGLLFRRQSRYDHRCRQCQGRGDKILHLPGPPFAFDQILGELFRLFRRAAGVGADEVRHEVLLFARGFARFGEFGLERLEGVVMRFLHHVQHHRADVFGGDLEVAADEVFGQEPNVIGALQGQIVPDAGGDEDVRFFLVCVSPLQDGLEHGDDGVVGR